MNKDKIIEKQKELIDYLISCIENGFDYQIDTLVVNKFQSEIAALLREPDQDLPSDEEIEEWIKADANWSKTFINGAIYGAKAMRDGWIKSNRK